MIVVTHDQRWNEALAEAVDNLRRERDEARAEVEQVKRELAYKEERRQYWQHEACKENARAELLGAKLSRRQPNEAMVEAAYSVLAERGPRDQKLMVHKALCAALAAPGT